MEKFLVCSMSIFILLLNPIKALAYGVDEITEVAEETLKVYMDKYTSNDAGEDEKLKAYYFGNYSGFTSYEDFKAGKDIIVRMSVLVYPEKADSSKWSGYQKLDYEGSIYGQGYNVPDYYIRMTKDGEKYKIVYIDFVPEGYAEYVQKMKDKEIDVENINLQELINRAYEEIPEIETTEITEQAGKVEEFKSKNEVIEKTKIKIIIFCSLMIVVCLGIYIRKIIK